METTTRSHHPVRLRSFELNLRTRELYCNGTRLNLHGHPIDVLAMLVEQPGELVTRQAIQNKLWPSGTFVDSEHMLNNSIAKLRDALGDHAEHPQFIETLPRLGYRFMARVDPATGNFRSFVTTDHQQHASDITPTNPSLRDPPVARPARQARSLSKKLARLFKRFKFRATRSRWTLLALAVTVVALLAAFSFVVLKNRAITKERPSNIRSLSVMPFENLSGDPLKDELAESMTDSLIIELSKSDLLEIIPRSSVMRNKGTSKASPQVIRELNADFIVEGTVLEVGERVVTGVKLIEAPSRAAIWAKSYESDIRDAVTLEIDVARDIAVKIRAVSQR